MYVDDADPTTEEVMGVDESPGLHMFELRRRLFTAMSWATMETAISSTQVADPYRSIDQDQFLYRDPVARRRLVGLRSGSEPPRAARRRALS